MKYQIVGKNIVVTEAISNIIKKKLARMDAYFDPNEDVSCRAVVRSYKTGAKVEITIFTKDTILRTEVKNDDLYAAVDLSVDKLEGQMRHLKTKMKRRYEHEGIGKAILYEQIEDEENAQKDARVVKTKNLNLKPMTIEDAALNMESIGHSFYLYLDTDDEKISLIYKRNDGEYGLLQADNKVEIK